MNEINNNTKNNIVVSQLFNLNYIPTLNYNILQTLLNGNYNLNKEEFFFDEHNNTDLFYNKFFNNSNFLEIEIGIFTDIINSLSSKFDLNFNTMINNNTDYITNLFRYRKPTDIEPIINLFNFDELNFNTKSILYKTLVQNGFIDSFSQIIQKFPNENFNDYYFYEANFNSSSMLGYIEKKPLSHLFKFHDTNSFNRIYDMFKDSINMEESSTIKVFDKSKFILETSLAKEKSLTYDYDLNSLNQNKIEKIFDENIFCLKSYQRNVFSKFISVHYKTSKEIFNKKIRPRQDSEKLREIQTDLTKFFDSLNEKNINYFDKNDITKELFMNSIVKLAEIFPNIFIKEIKNNNLLKSVDLNFKHNNKSIIDVLLTKGEIDIANKLLKYQKSNIKEYYEKQGKHLFLASFEYLLQFDQGKITDKKKQEIETFFNEAFQSFNQLDKENKTNIISQILTNFKGTSFLFFLNKNINDEYEIKINDFSNGNNYLALNFFNSYNELNFDIYSKDSNNVIPISNLFSYFINNSNNTNIINNSVDKFWLAHYQFINNFKKVSSLDEDTKISIGNHIIDNLHNSTYIKSNILNTSNNNRNYSNEIYYINSIFDNIYKLIDNESTFEAIISGKAKSSFILQYIRSIPKESILSNNNYPLISKISAYVEKQYLNDLIKINYKNDNNVETVKIKRNNRL